MPGVKELNGKRKAQSNQNYEEIGLQLSVDDMKRIDKAVEEFGLGSRAQYIAYALSLFDYVLHELKDGRTELALVEGNDIKKRLALD